MPDTKHYWALPDGINEALPDEAKRFETLRREIIDLYTRWGYQLVMTPLVEYMESLSTGAGSNLDLQTFKITDQQTGRLMGIRADMTPQIARIDAHKLQNNGSNPLNRLCYIGTVLRTRSTHQETSRSPRQIGAELFGHSGIDSDFEVIAMMLSTLQHCQVPDTVLDLGHVAIFEGLVSYAGLNDEQQAAYLSMLERKSLPEIRDWLAAHNFSDDIAALLNGLPRLHGSVDVLDEARALFKGSSADIETALDHLQQLVQRIQAQFPNCQLHIDLSELSGYDYHTGVIYAAYSQANGQEIARGGRYDGIGEVFGRSRPATGFSTDLRTLAQFAHPKLPETHAIFAPASNDTALETTIMTLRQQGEHVIRQLSGQEALSPADMGCTRQIIQQDGQWTVTDV